MEMDRKDSIEAKEKIKPCLVCGDKAIGYYYEVECCGACKIFFR